MLCNAQAMKEKYLDQHVLSIKNHIKELAGKNYAELEKINTIDSVTMFIPIEAAYVEAMKHDRFWFEYVFERQIILSHPMNLWSNLKTIHFLWRNDKQNKNSKEIARQAGKMYAKFVVFIEKLEKVGNQLNTARSTLQIPIRVLPLVKITW